MNNDVDQLKSLLENYTAKVDTHLSKFLSDPQYLNNSGATVSALSSVLPQSANVLSALLHPTRRIIEVRRCLYRTVDFTYIPGKGTFLSGWASALPTPSTAENDLTLIDSDKPLEKQGTMINHERVKPGAQFDMLAVLSFDCGNLDNAERLLEFLIYEH